MHIIADSGGTSISWALVARETGRTEVIQTPGYNAVTSADGLLADIIAASRLSQASGVESVEFYGAGCGTAEACGRVERQLKARFGAGVDVSVGSDMLGAARALLGSQPGVACILGTGSNSCLYDGRSIVANVPPLGFILGDEGSGAVLGRTLLGAVFKRTLAPDLIEAFEEEYPGLGMAEVIENVYRRPGPNTWLASFAPFLCRHADHPEAERMAIDEFRRFFRRNVAMYRLDGLNREVGFVGSVAVHFRPQLEKAARAEGFAISRVMAGPLDGLTDRYLSGRPD